MGLIHILTEAKSIVSKETLHLLKNIKPAIDKGDLDKAIALSSALERALRADVYRAKAAASNPNDPELVAIKAASLEYFNSWDDDSLLELKAASNFEEIVDAIAGFAQAVGDRKGYGSEGVAELESEFQTDIAEKAGVGDYFERDRE